MADLSNYIDFSCVLRKSDQVIRLTDPNNYPAGVGETLEGFFTITQPDGLTITGSFADPEVYWSGGALVQPELELRLNAANRFQKGNYTVTYTARATGYDETVLTKTFYLDYTVPTMVLTKNFDVFTPDLSVTDATNYTTDNPDLTYAAIVRTWLADIISVEGVNRQISGSAITFDLAYLGAYYDSQYDVSLSVDVTYQLQDEYDFASIIDTLAIEDTYYAYIPPTLAELLVSLTSMKTEHVDNKGCICSRSSNCGDCITRKADYTLAVSIYTHLVERGRKEQLTGLELYVSQLQKIFNNCVTPSYTNTNEEIPAYDWGTSGGGVAWGDITGKPQTYRYQWKVGDPGFPGLGDIIFTNANLAGVPQARVIVMRNAPMQFNSSAGDADTYITKNTVDNFFTFSAALGENEKIIVIILPL